MFRLSKTEFEDWKSHSVTANPGSGSMRSQNVTASKRNIRFSPYAFTEQGVSMLSSVLRSKRAVLVNIEIMRAFVRMRHILATHADLACKLDALEKKYDAQFKVVFDAIRELMTLPPDPPRGKFGFARDRQD